MIELNKILPSAKPHVYKIRNYSARLSNSIIHFISIFPIYLVLLSAQYFKYLSTTIDIKIILTNQVNISVEDYPPCVAQNKFNTCTKHYIKARSRSVHNTTLFLK